MSSLSIYSLALFFDGEQQLIERGEEHYMSDHVESFSYSTGVVRGTVRESMENKSYKVTLYLDCDLNIQSTKCECPRGEYKCSHAAAVYIYGIHNLSRTDVECQWEVKETSENTILSASELFPKPEGKEDYKALTREPTEEDRKWLYNELRKHGRSTGLYWLLSQRMQDTNDKN